MQQTVRIFNHSLNGGNAAFLAEIEQAETLKLNPVFWKNCLNGL